MPSPRAFITAAVSRLLPQALPDDGGSSNDQPVRAGRYRELYALSLVRKSHLLADEGSFFVTNNAQTGIAMAATPTAFSATNPFVLLYNGDSAGGKRIYLDAITLVCTAADTAGTSLQAAVTIDTVNRYTSGGTNLTANIVNPNMDISPRATVANVYAGNLTASAATAGVRTVVGTRILKVKATPAMVALDQITLNFGGVEGINFASSPLSGTTSVITVPMPPVIIGPGDSALVHLWLPSVSTGPSFEPEISWWER